MLRDAAATQQKLKELAELGVKIALDDFGTGFSALVYLRDLPTKVLKLDKTFVEQGKSNGILVQGITALAGRLDQEVVAEGIETASQRDLMVSLGCKYLQGYYFAPPMPERHFSSWLKSSKDSWPVTP